MTEKNDVEEGNLTIISANTSHKIKEDLMYICTVVKHNMYGQSLGPKIHYETCDELYCDEPVVKVGEYLELEL